MANLTDLEKIINVEGVSEYLLIDPSGKILSQNMKNHVIISSMVISCASICKLITAERFHYLVFSQNDHKDFYIFIVGKHYLAIRKKADCPPADLPKNVANFIKKLASSN